MYDVFLSLFGFLKQLYLSLQGGGGYAIAARV